MAASSKAEAAEKEAYQKLHRLLGNPPAFAQPAGFSTDFPDFGFRLNVDRKNIDVFIEYKADAKAQMGSMRDWKFDGTKFYTSDKTNAEKEGLIAVMNKSSDCVKNGKRILGDMKTYFDKSVKEISSGMLTTIKDQQLRRAKLVNFTHNTANYQLAKIENSAMGQGILDHYHKKFTKGLRSDADYSILMMMIGDELWYLEDSGTIDPSSKTKIAEKFGVKNFAVMNSLKANLEVRIQPRGLSAPNKPVSIDVMASFRLAGKPSAGTRVI